MKEMQIFFHLRPIIYYEQLMSIIQLFLYHNYNFHIHFGLFGVYLYKGFAIILAKTSNYEIKNQ